MTSVLLICKGLCCFWLLLLHQLLPKEWISSWLFCKMSMRTLPLVFINLGGEMLYILDQRLRAHNTSEDSSEKGRGGCWTDWLGVYVFSPQSSLPPVQCWLTNSTRASHVSMHQITLDAFFSFFLFLWKPRSMVRKWQKERYLCILQEIIISSSVYIYYSAFYSRSSRLYFRQ